MQEVQGPGRTLDLTDRPPEAMSQQPRSKEQLPWDPCSGRAEEMPAPFPSSSAKVGAVSKLGTTSPPF